VTDKTERVCSESAQDAMRAREYAREHVLQTLDLVYGGYGDVQREESAPALEEEGD
jgi:hypothetical protein